MNRELSVAREVILNLKTIKNTISFQKLWTTVCNKLKITETVAADTASDFYIALLENPSFVKITGNEWTLKEFFAYDDVKKINSPVYPTEEFEINEDEYSEYLSSDEIKQLKNHKERVTLDLDLGDLDDSTGETGRSLKSAELGIEDDDADSGGEEYDE